MKDFLDPATISRVMSHMAAQRKRQDSTCERCGKVTPDAYRKRRFCSNSCRVLAHRARHRENPEGLVSPASLSHSRRTTNSPHNRIPAQE
jgi:hypothetical protein